MLLNAGGGIKGNARQLLNSGVNSIKFSLNKEIIKKREKKTQNQAYGMIRPQTITINDRNKEEVNDGRTIHFKISTKHINIRTCSLNEKE
jgi:hypothetical protein